MGTKGTSMRGAIIILGAIVAVGCGGGGAASPEPEDEPAPIADTGGGEDADVEPEPEPEPEPPRATGPGQLTVTNSVGNQPGGGTVQVIGPGGAVVAEGRSGQTFTVDAGTYRLRGAITEASVLVDTPTLELDGEVTVPAGQTVTSTINFPVAHILLRVRRAGRDVAAWTLEIAREGRGGSNRVRLTPSTEHVPITPGRYSGTLRQGGQQIEVSGLIFQGGARMTVPVDVN
ncbi:MAG: hypothetical protein KF729_03705 [Sandaracinaceae bacterium]|nr:hypothetical protein [Sandaracinaceae bacterium]